VLDRYLSRLVALRRMPEALEVLRGELDSNPKDPGLYDKLAKFLEQNRVMHTRMRYTSGPSRNFRSRATARRAGMPSWLASICAKSVKRITRC